MATPNSSATSYADGDDMLQRYDVRTIADLINDTGTRTGGSPNPNPSQVTSNTKLLTALKSASGMVEAALLRAQRYSPEDLHALDGVSKEFLIQIVCDLAMGLLFRRRPDKGIIPPAFLEAMKWLEGLANGERIFAFDEHEAAGNPDSFVESAAIINERNLVPQQARRFFGVTGDVINPYTPNVSPTN